MMSNRWLRWLAACGIAGQALFFLSWFVAQFFEHDSYSIMRDFTSDLGALTAAHPLPYNLGTSVSGLLTAAFAIAVYAVFRGSLPGRIGAACIAVNGVGTFLDGILREDCSPRLASCKALDASQGFSWHHQAHDIETLFTALAAIAAPFLLAVAFRRVPAWSRFWKYLLAIGIADIAILIPFLITASQAGQPGAGLLARIIETVATAWFAVLGWWIWTGRLKPAKAGAGAPADGRVLGSTAPT